MASPLSYYDLLYIRFFYLLRSLQYDLPENKVGWRSRQNQELRFQALRGIGDLQGRSLLDLGCGLGCLYGFLREKGWEGQYTGFDILPSMVNGAQARFPGVRFEKRDLLEEPVREEWDYVLINGIFNHKVRDNWGWIESTIKRCLLSARKGVGFTILNAEAGWPDGDLFYAIPRELEERVKVWSSGKYKIVTGYLPEDMTVYLYKGSAEL